MYKPKTFSPVSSINSTQTDKALPVKTSKPNCVTFLVYFGKSFFDCLWNFFVFYGSKPGSQFARNLREFGVARSEELGVNQWIVLDIPRLSNQSERAKNTIHCLFVFFFVFFSGILGWIVLVLVWFQKSLHSVQVSGQSCPWLLKLMTSQAVESTWTGMGGYGRLRSEWVNK